MARASSTVSARMPTSVFGASASLLGRLWGVGSGGWRFGSSRAARSMSESGRVGWRRVGWLLMMVACRVFVSSASLGSHIVGMLQVVEPAPGLSLNPRAVGLPAGLVPLWREFMVEPKGKSLGH